MSSAASSFFSRDTLLRRHARVYRSHRNGTKSLPHIILSSRRGSLLDIIPEEEDLPSMPTNISRQKAQRRPARNVFARDRKGVLDDIAEETLPSQDDFNVTLSDISLTFPLPPVPVSCSPSPSSCRSPSPSFSLSSSPDSQSAGLPRTPSSSDDEFLLPSPAFNPRRAAITPLVINKPHRPSGLTVVDHLGSDSDSESDSEWYTREFSKLLTLNSKHPQCSFPAQRDSISLEYPSPVSPPLPERRHRRNSGSKHSLASVPPLSPAPAHYIPDSITTCRRPPPNTSIPDDACSAFSLSLYTDDTVEPESSLLSICAPESIQDFIKDEQDIEFPDGFEMHVDCPMMLPLSIPSSPIDLEADIAIGLAQLRLKELANASVEVVDQVQKVAPSGESSGVGFFFEEDPKVKNEVTVPQVVFTSPPSSPLRAPSPIPDAAPAHSRSGSLAFSTISSFSFPPTPTLVPCSSDVPQRNHEVDEQHGLKSKWSSSTLSSVREQQASSGSRFPGAAKLKGYFQSQHKRSNSSTSAPPSTKVSRFSRSPSPTKSKNKEKEKKERDTKVKTRRKSDVLVIGYSHSGPRHSHDSYYADVPTSPRRSYDKAPPVSPSRLSYDAPAPPSPLRHRGHGRNGLTSVRRTPSQCSVGGVSDCGSEASCASVSSEWSGVLSSGLGLRRKPIPVEMFLRSAC